MIMSINDLSEGLGNFKEDPVKVLGSFVWGALHKKKTKPAEVVEREDETVVQEQSFTEVTKEQPGKASTAAMIAAVLFGGAWADAQSEE